MEGFNGNGVMGFADGDGNGGLSPLMIMPLMASHPSGVDQNPFFIPPPNHGHARSFKNDGNDNEAEKNRSDVKAKIMCHPHYPRLLSAYINCHKLGAPPEVVARMGEICGGGGGGESCRLGDDPALDQFMEAYCEMLMKYEEELSKPFKEAMIFLSRMETQFKSLTLSSSSSLQDPLTGGGKGEMPGSSSEDGGDMASEAYVDPHAEDRELKGQLLRKYSGYLGGLKQEFLKRRKKGKLPKEARFQLLDWWNRHYKWPYPSESQKLALAESTGLDQKQINNWFINQRKRHWKPAEEMQFAAVAAAAAAHAAAGVPQPAEIGRAHYYLDNAFSVGGFGAPFSDLPRPY